MSGARMNLKPIWGINADEEEKEKQKYKYKTGYPEPDKGSDTYAETGSVP